MDGQRLSAVLLVLIAAGASILALALCALIIRRALQEQRSYREASRADAFRRALIPNLGSPETVSLGAWRGDPVALEVAIHLVQLLRGNDRLALLNIIEHLDLLGPVYARLRSKRAAHRTAAIRALGNFPFEAAHKPLRRHLAQDTSRDVRLEAGLALARLGALPEPVGVMEALDDDAFASPAHRLILRATARQYPAAFPALWTHSQSTGARLAILDALGEIMSSGSFAVLLNACENDDPQLRCEALRALRRLGHPAAINAVLVRLNDPEWIVRVQAAAAAGVLGAKSARDRLRELRQDPHYWVQYRAAEALTKLEVRSAA